jgi:hypothetical protein
VEHVSESRPVVGFGVGVKLMRGVLYVMGFGVKILHELATQVNGHLAKGTSAITENLEVFKYILPLLVLLIRQLLQVGNKVAVLFALVNDAKSLVDYLIVATATSHLCNFKHRIVMVSLHFILRLGVDVYTERIGYTALHGVRIPIAGIITKEERLHFPIVNVSAVDFDGLCLIVHTCGI